MNLITDYNNWNDIIKNEIMQNDLRYLDIYEEIILLSFLRENVLKLRIVKINYNYIENDYVEKNLYKIPKGHFYPMILYYFLSNGFTNYRCENDIFVGVSGKPDVFISKYNSDLLIEFGQCRIDKLYEYLKKFKYFVIACDYNKMIIVKRSKNFDKAMKWLYEEKIKSVSKYKGRF